MCFIYINKQLKIYFLKILYFLLLRTKKLFYVSWYILKQLPNKSKLHKKIWIKDQVICEILNSHIFSYIYHCSVMSKSLTLLRLYNMLLGILILKGTIKETLPCNFSRLVIWFKKRYVLTKKKKKGSLSIKLCTFTNYLLPLRLDRDYYIYIYIY